MDIKDKYYLFCVKKYIIKLILISILQNKRNVCISKTARVNITKNKTLYELRNKKYEKEIISFLDKLSLQTNIGLNYIIIKW